MSHYDVTVIVPTLCETKRSNELIRAISSIENQIDIKAKILVIVNGNRYDKELLKKIDSMDNVTTLMLDKAGISQARYHGRKHVDTDFFAFLDDDDEYYPYTLKELIGSFSVSDNTGLVIGDAYNTHYKGNYGFVASIEEIEKKPLEALLKENWLIIQSALFKTSLVPSHLFDIQSRSNECTILAFKICLEDIKVRVNKKSLAIIHYSETSESKTEHFITQETDTLKYIMKMGLPDNIRIELKKKLSKSHHNNSVYYLKKNDILKSFSEHLRSLVLPGGCKYILYTRYILLKLIKKVVE